MVPAWLAQSVNGNALNIGKQEMTAVGRTVITKFLVDEIFSKSFHPALPLPSSLLLKEMELNIRRFSAVANNQEEADAITGKVVQWRLTSLESLREVLASPESEQNKAQFTHRVTQDLTDTLISYLQEGAEGIQDSAHMIVELAVSIACNLPLESRELSITYPMPGDIVQPFLMKPEAGIPALETPGADTDDMDAPSSDEGQKEVEKPSNKLHKDKPKGMLQSMMGGSSTGPTGKRPSISSQGGEGPPEAKSKQSSEDGMQRVRFAGFLGVEVRGRQVLSKAPVWTLG